MDSNRIFVDPQVLPWLLSYYLWELLMDHNA